ncbi:MAG: NAD-dependent epimerase/dehydratase family protein [Nitrospirae bacterium]|nr:NAD-dependent epimerase/dehydratase family protein [Nitrospirota bacterium]
MKCLVLGGGGFLGYHLCRALLDAGHEVRIFDRPNIARYTVPSPYSIEWSEGDFVNSEDLERALTGCDIIYHLVSTTLPGSSNDNPSYDIETNVVGTIRLLDLVRGDKFRKIVFLSSGGTVYGTPKDVPIRESHPTDPVCSYGIAKLTIEKYLFLYHYLYGLDYCIFRFANPFGERQRIEAAQGAVTVFLHNAFHGQPIEIWGDGTVIRDYIYVKDAVDVLVRAIGYAGSHRVFNIGSGEGRSLNQVLAEIEVVLGRHVPLTRVPGRPFDVPSNVLDISLASEMLGWRPKISFREGLLRTLEWIREPAGQG